MTDPARPDQTLRRFLRARSPGPSGPLSAIALLLLLVAAGLATGMARSAWSGAAVAGCTGDGCAEVAASDYAWVAGTPVALWGALAYLGAAGALILRQGRLLQGIAGLIAGAALWFVVVQAFVIGAWCPACLSLHGLALAGVGLALLASPRVTERPAPRRAVLRFGGLSGRGAVGAGLALGFVAPGVLPADRPEVKVETVALTPREGARALVGGVQLFEGAFELKRGDYPLYGDPAADRISVLLWDPLCPHCREMQPLLIEAGEALATSGTAILSLPVSTSASGGAWARDLMAAWIADPAGYPALAAALAGTEETDTALASADPVAREAWFATVRGEAGEKTASESSDEKADERLALARRLLLAAWERADQAVVPVLIAGDDLHLGGFGSSEGLVAAVAPDAGLVAGDFKDPCDPRGRAFCGRLIISMIAAGEEPSGQAEAHRALADDLFEHNAFNHLRQFSPVGANLPVMALAFSSDEGFNAKAPKLFNGRSRKFVGVHPMSVDVFPDAFGADAQKSYLLQALAEFEKNSGCQKLKQDRGLDSVVPLLKVEVIMDGHTTTSSGQPAFAAWKHSHEKGEFSLWQEGEKGYFEREQWKMLTRTLQGSVIQLFSASCNSSDLAANFERHIEDEMPDSHCSCYVGATSKKQEDYVSSYDNPFFNSAMDDEGQSMRKNNDIPNSWSGAASIAAMQAGLYNKHRGAVLTPKTSSLGSAFKTTLDGDILYERNPLMGFVWNSADVLAEEALEAIRDANQGARGTILIAQFMHEMPPNLPSRVIPTDEVKEVYEKVIARIAAIERSYEPLLKDSKGRLDSSVFDSEYANFSDCNNGKSTAPEACIALKSMLDEIGINYKNDIEKDFAITKKVLVDALVINNVRGIWKSYVDRQESISDVFE